MLASILNKRRPQDLRLKLYKNDKTPAADDIAGDYAVADFKGYEDFDFVAAKWTITPGSPTRAAYPEQSFVSSADQRLQLVYGYFVVQAASGKLMWAERFSDGPYKIRNNGDAVKVAAGITLEKGKGI